mmetsp:Transcript_10980/g.32946  ORF Transcript_10980/g.32946 Transcript_10980/m.32946 type:complete len:324 (-) Transcript_10980:3000-3971(-)
MGVQRTGGLSPGDRDILQRGDVATFHQRAPRRGVERQRRPERSRRRERLALPHGDRRLPRRRLQRQGRLFPSGLQRLFHELQQQLRRSRERRRRLLPPRRRGAARPLRRRRHHQPHHAANKLRAPCGDGSHAARRGRGTTWQYLRDLQRAIRTDGMLFDAASHRVLHEPAERRLEDAGRRAGGRGAAARHSPRVDVRARERQDVLARRAKHRRGQRGPAPGRHLGSGQGPVGPEPDERPDGSTTPLPGGHRRRRHLARDGHDRRLPERTSAAERHDLRHQHRRILRERDLDPDPARRRRLRLLPRKGLRRVGHLRRPLGRHHG